MPRGITLAALGIVSCCVLLTSAARKSDAPDAGRHTPLIIAHRGASGYLPEHTLPAYAMAYGQDADYLEPDVVLTRDGVPICNHDITLERTTNVEQVFPDRARADGKWYAIDFTLAELRRLRVDTPPRHAKASETPGVAGFRIATLREMLELVRLLNERTGHRVGIIPEPKRAGFHRDEGRPLEKPLVDLLREFGYVHADDPCIIQSFEVDALRHIRGGLQCRLRLVFLAGDQEALDRAGGLPAVAKMADGIGPAWKLADENRGELVRAAHERGLAVYPWTFARDRKVLSRFLHDYRVDGLFTDFPDIALAVRDEQRPDTAPAKR